MTRTKSIKIRLTESEHRRLEKLAGKRGISALLRTRALGADRRQRQSTKLAVIAEFARATNVLNRIARICEGRPAAEQIKILLELIAVQRQLSALKN